MGFAVALPILRLLIKTIMAVTMPVGVCNPDQTFEGFNGFQNVSDGVAIPVTLQCLMGFAVALPILRLTD